MKKTFPVNINGNIFYIDEDAYKLLLDYLSQLRATFSGDEGEEIVNDIESRISEHFDERIRLGANVIVLDDVNRVIETMGRPEDLSEETETETGTAAPSDSESANVPPFNGTQTPPPAPVHKKLYRDVRHSVFGGVIAGLSQYLGWDVTVMRILAVVLTLCTYFWPCVIIYLIAWMVIPVARTPREILEMQGQPVTLDNIGQTVINNSVPPAAPVPSQNPSSFSSFINNIFSIAAKLIIGFFGVICGLSAIGIVCVILAAIAGIILFSIAGNPVIIEGLSWAETNAPVIESWGYICVLLAVFIFCFAVARYACIPIFKAKAPSTPVIVTLIIFEIIAILAAVILLAIAEHSGSSTLLDTWAMTSTAIPSTFHAALPSTLQATLSTLTAHMPILPILQSATLIIPIIAA